MKRTAEQRVMDLEIGAEYENAARGEYCEFSAIANEAIGLLRWVVRNHPHGDLPMRECPICNSKRLRDWLDGEEKP